MIREWEQMASVITRKLVENGQTRILQRIYEGITSDFVLDVADGKSSMDHQLIHLVWRKFPRNRHSMEGLHLTVSTQTEEASSSSLGSAASAELTGLLPKLTTSNSTQTTEDMRPGPKHISRNYVASVSDCVSQPDLEELFNENGSLSDSDDGVTSGCSMSSANLTLEFDNSFKKPAKRRTGKPLSPEKKFQTHLSNRFDSLEEVNSPGNLYENSDLSDRKPVSGSRGNRSRPPKLVNESKVLQISKTSILKSCEIATTSKINNEITSDLETSSVSPKCSEITQSVKEVIPCCSNDAEDNRREEGTVTRFNSRRQFGTITPDTYISGRDPGSLSLYFYSRTYLHSAKDSGIKEGDRVNYVYEFSRYIDGSPCNEAKDIRVIDNG